MNRDSRVAVSLLILRIGVFLVMFMWTLDKFINPDHATRVYEGFYYLSGFEGTLMTIIGIAEMIIILGFLAGFMKFWTYGLVLLFHAVSTLSSYARYFDPWENLLFFAAWPMLAACIALFLLRDLDTLYSMGGSKASVASPQSDTGHSGDQDPGGY